MLFFCKILLEFCRVLKDLERERERERNLLKQISIKWTFTIISGSQCQPSLDVWLIYWLVLQNCFDKVDFHHNTNGKGVKREVINFVSEQS